MLNNTNKQKIYSIRTDSTNSATGIVEIETVILNGLYKFSILGLNRTNSSDTKDRVYSALRSQKLINLKSDNKKIIVNILPADIHTKNNILDLGIALSCLYSMHKIDREESVLIIGELSIVGNIISTGFLLKSIHQAIENNIKTIICSKQDFDILHTEEGYLQNLIQNNNIKIIAGETLGDLFENIKNKKYFLVKTGTQANTKEGKVLPEFDFLDTNILKIVLGLCTKRNIFIENTKDSYVKKFINNLKYYSQKINENEILILANSLNVFDWEILERYTYSKVSILDNQILKKDLIFLLNESIFGFNIIKNFLNLNDEMFNIIKKFHLSSIVCFYNPCPCGNNNIFFNNIDNERCFCIQKNILRYRQNIKLTENNFFDFYINNINHRDNLYTPVDYIGINNIISIFRNTNIEIEEGDCVKFFIKNNNNKYEIDYLDKIIILAKDICKLRNLSNTTIKYYTLQQKDIDLALELSKKDF